MCHNELGPGTEYGRCEVIVDPHRSAILSGSVLLKIEQTRSLETDYTQSPKMTHHH